MPNTLVPAAATGLPASRRSFLRALTHLPLIGGGVALIGAPSAVAEPVTLPLMRRYAAWLAREHGLAHDQYLAMLDPKDRYPWPGGEGVIAPIEPIAHTYGSHWPEDQVAWTSAASAPPSTRAALVLSAVGCDWREGTR